MTERRWMTALLCVALAPSAWLAWSWREMPQLGLYHDDAIYLVAAKSLAEGDGYKIASLPGEPYQTKYPPVFPMLLAALWRLDSSFPGNLPKVMVFSWAGLAACVFLMRRALREAGFNEWESGGIAAFAAVSPAVALFGLLAMSELWFTVFLMAALMAAERGRSGWAGLVGGLAFLTRTACLPLVVTGPLVYLWRREYRRAALFFAGMLPAVAGWQWWVSAHRAAGSPATLFYTDYFGFYLRDVTLAGLPSLLAFNTDMAIKAIGELFIANPDHGIGAMTVARLVAAAAICGCVRLVFAGRLTHYAAFAAAYTAQFIVWNYPPTQRFFVPLIPLLAAGVWRELQGLKTMITGSIRQGGANRGVALAMCGVLLLIAGDSLRWSANGLFQFFPELFEERRQLLARQREAYDWVGQHTGETAKLLSYHDPVDYLYTGRQGLSLRVPPGMLQRAEKEELQRFFNELPAIMSAHGVDHGLLGAGDYHMDGPGLTLKPYRAVFDNSAVFERVYERGGAAVYRIRNGGAYDRHDVLPPSSPEAAARRDTSGRP